MAIKASGKKPKKERGSNIPEDNSAVINTEPPSNESEPQKKERKSLLPRKGKKEDNSREVLLQPKNVEEENKAVEVKTVQSPTEVPKPKKQVKKEAPKNPTQGSSLQNNNVKSVAQPKAGNKSFRARTNNRIFNSASLSEATTKGMTTLQIIKDSESKLAFTSNFLTDFSLNKTESLQDLEQVVSQPLVDTSQSINPLDISVPSELAFIHQAPVEITINEVAPEIIAPIVQQPIVTEEIIPAQPSAILNPIPDSNPLNLDEEILDEEILDGEILDEETSEIVIPEADEEEPSIEIVPEELDEGLVEEEIQDEELVAEEVEEELIDEEIGDGDLVSEEPEDLNNEEIENEPLIEESGDADVIPDEVVEEPVSLFGSTAFGETEADLDLNELDELTKDLEIANEEITEHPSKGELQSIVESTEAHKPLSGFQLTEEERKALLSKEEDELIEEVSFGKPLNNNLNIKSRTFDLDVEKQMHSSKDTTLKVNNDFDINKSQSESSTVKIMESMEPPKEPVIKGFEDAYNLLGGNNE